MAPSPSEFLAAVAQRTRRLRFGPLVYALPLYHPIRLIEEFGCSLSSAAAIGDRFWTRRLSNETSFYALDQRRPANLREGLALVIKALEC